MCRIWIITIMLNNRYRKVLSLILFFIFIHVSCMYANYFVPADKRISVFAQKNFLSKEKLLHNINDFKSQIIKATDYSSNGNVYITYNINVKKRNAALLLVPSMYYIAKGKRRYAGETLTCFNLHNGKVNNINVKASTGTIPKNKNVISIMKNMLVPDIYGETIFGEFLLSPCNKYNQSLYKYKISRLTFDRVEIIFKPKVKNTQLVSGRAIINGHTGRIIFMSFRGEMDMLKFFVIINMGNSADEMTFIPKSCKINTEFKFMGNIVTASHVSYFNRVDESKLIKLNSHNNDTIMETLRPVPLDNGIKEIYKNYNNDKCISSIVSGKGSYHKDSILQDTVSEINKKTSKYTTKNSILKKITSSLSDYFLDKIGGNFGSEAQGNYRISPLMNPLSLGYSNKKGLTYKIRLYGGYRFSDNSDINISIKTGYSFKQKQFYTNIPLKVNLNRTLSLGTEFGVGNRITNSEILNKIKNEKIDSIRWDKMNLDYFRDLFWNIKLKIKAGNKLSITPGITYHRRSATDKYGFIISGKPYKYHSFAPTLQFQYNPWYDKGPIFTVDYERGIKGVIKSSMNYERIETDISWKKYLHSMRLLSMKAGYGIYTSKSQETFFLDFTNFRYENIPGGWDDDWTGEFQLLNSNWYNASKFYSRANITYESPLLILSWVPIVGKYIETERIYSNWLFTDMLHPYIEAGYGFTNKIFSTGIFFSVSNKKIGAFGIRFGIELFKEW